MASSAPKKLLRKIRALHLVDPDELKGFDEWAEYLEAILHNQCSIWEKNGELILIERRQLVKRLDGLKIEIYPNEHPPPHFHVTSPNIKASFLIEDCSLLKGKLQNKDLKKILFWHGLAKKQLIKAWNSTRPTNCMVGALNAT